MPRLRLLLFEAGGGLCLFLRLPGAKRILVDCGDAGLAALRFLRELGEIGPLKPLNEHLRLGREDPEAGQWLGVLSLVRGLVLRPGGSWVLWRATPWTAEGFALKARVRAHDGGAPVPWEGGGAPLLVMGLGPEEVLALGGPPAGWVANASLALLMPGDGGGALLFGGDLRPAAWSRLLAGGGLPALLAGVTRYAAGEPEGPWGQGHDLSRGLTMAVLPWLVLGGLAGGGGDSVERGSRACLGTPEVGVLSLEVADDGEINVCGWPWETNRLAWRGLARPLTDPALPAPWSLRRALAAA